jgi:hypothetical protein
MAKLFPDFNNDPSRDENKPRSSMVGERLQDIGRVLNRQAELKGVQDTAMFQRMDSIFTQFTEDVKDESGAGLRGASSAQLESFTTLKNLLIDMRKDNGENLEKYRQEVSKLMGKISVTEGSKSSRTFLQTQAQNILEQTEKPIQTKTGKFSQAIADKFGMKDFSVKSFFNLENAFEKESILGKTFNKPEPSAVEMANLEGQLEELKAPSRPPSRSRPTYSGYGRRRSFVGAFADEDQDESQPFRSPKWQADDRFSQSIVPKPSTTPAVSAKPTPVVEGSGQVSRKAMPSAEPLKITTLTVDRVIAKSLDVEKPSKARALPPRDERGRFISSGVQKAAVMADIGGQPAAPATESGLGLGDVAGLGAMGKGALGKAAAIGGTALSWAAPAAAMVGVGAAADYGLGKLGVGKTAEGQDIQIDEKADDANWQKMSWWEKAQSGAARGIEKVGSAAFLGNMSRQAQSERIAKESAYFAEKEGGVPVTKKATLINAAPEALKKDEAELSKLAASKQQAPIIVQAPAAPAPAAQQSIVMPIKGNVRPNESALEKMQSRTFTR